MLGELDVRDSNCGHVSDLCGLSSSTRDMLNAARLGASVYPWVTNGRGVRSIRRIADGGGAFCHEFSSLSFLCVN